jgi:hypothetical protein
VFILLLIVAFVRGERIGVVKHRTYCDTRDGEDRDFRLGRIETSVQRRKLELFPADRCVDCSPSLAR